MPQQLTTKSRGHLRTIPLANFQTWILGEGGWVLNNDPAPSLYVASGVYESLTSVGHRGPPYKEGGPFSLRRYKFSIQHTNADSTPVFNPDNFTLGAVKYVPQGQVTIDPFNLGYAGFSAPTDVDNLKYRHDNISFPVIPISTYGPKAIDKASPLNPSVKFGQFIGELRDLPKLPLLYQKRLKFFQNLGGQYLNVEFGWKPFIKDLQAFYTAWVTLDSRIQQIVRDNGLPVRRKGTILKELDTTVNLGVPKYNDMYPQYASYNSGYYSDPNMARGTDVTTNISTDVWFAARTRYYLPWEASNEWPLRAKLALFGLEPTPSLLYELMPWSWLIDWFSNLGEVITNLSSNGIADLIIDYAYVMRHYKKVSHTTQVNADRMDHISSDPAFSRIGVNAPGSILSSTWTEETKERIAATPFGFGLQIDDLSARQLAILGSLGLSRQNFI